MYQQNNYQKYEGDISNVKVYEYIPDDEKTNRIIIPFEERCAIVEAIKYVTKSGIELGTATVSNTFGQSQSVSPKAFTGYTASAAQNVTWDSVTAKTITFEYSPTSYSITINCFNNIT